MNLKQQSLPLLVLASGLAIVVLGSPLFSLWFSFVVLGKVSFFAQILQVQSSPFIPLLPAFLGGGLCLVLGAAVMRPRHALLASIGAALLVINLVAGWFLGLLIIPRFSMSQITFNAEVWQNTDCASQRTRQRMLADLRNQLRDKTREEVVALIGEPTDGRSSYCLGPEPHIIPLDREFMQPTFNSGGQLVDLKVTGS